MRRCWKVMLAATVLFLARLGSAAIFYKRPDSTQSIQAFRIVDRPGKPASYPCITEGYQKTFRILEKLPCDVFLSAHGAYFEMLPKLDRAKVGTGQSVRIDPEGYHARLVERKNAFEAELARQKSGGN